jgi:hypothetical protein
MSQVGGAIQQFLLPEDGQPPKSGKIELDLPLLIGECGCCTVHTEVQVNSATVAWSVSRQQPGTCKSDTWTDGKLLFSYNLSLSQMLHTALVPQ